MGTYGNFNLVMREWKLGNITEAQAIGQILQLLEELEKRVAELERITKPPRATNTKPDQPKNGEQK
ncbi:MAG: hypothetical protein HZC38_01785 [Chloroflexi bacterium]|nr:hypothetical protein [Chloroflexota bacterium]MBI5082857.1 hypothetical protein [Chloroflexota bacterium]MBI5350404.1 hypothetical protein [Chloroflexota bacterium]MBI5712146.1 hypothetical protein [Chloroflexota bacterium]